MPQRIQLSRTPPRFVPSAEMHRLLMESQQRGVAQVLRHIGLRCGNCGARREMEGAKGTLCDECREAS